MTFIVFEGGDSVGKSTQATRLAQWLVRQGVAHTLTRQPGGTVIGNELRRLVLSPVFDVAPRAEALIYAADKAQHVCEVIEPALARGETVVCDRYVDSMIAYQGAGRALAIDEVSRIAWWAVGGRRPDLTILLDMDPAEAVAQVADKDRLEQAGLDLHRRARGYFLDLAHSEPKRYLVLDARDTREAIFQRIVERVEDLIRSQE